MTNVDAGRQEEPSEGVGEATWLRSDAAGDAVAGSLLDGRYRLLQQIGSGGLGVVWLADQTRPVRRKVAIKLVKPGMDSGQVLSRFQAERNALSIMNHPSIARVFDAGVTERGRPYFAMEYVAGTPITRFCDDERLDTRQRLELFLQVCDAVQHAHQKAIIHRDLKPSNILVCLHEGKPLAKVIDFGIAKATGAELSEGTVVTEFGQLLGTPEYMSPEQAEITAAGVDATTDIYSLGVILYELLTGALPFETSVLRSRGFAEIQRILREEEPPRPSTRISTLGDSTEQVVARRRTAIHSLQRLLRGDLDWITMKAMEKQRTRRYPSASELAADIQRHLEDQPVLAGPPTLAYRAAKFVRRYRAAVVSAALMLLVLALGVIGLAFGLLRSRELGRAAEVARAVAEAEAGRARRSEEEAQEQRARAEDAAAKAQTEARRASGVTDFVLGVLGLADPNLGNSPNTTVRDLLVRAGSRVGYGLRDDPRAERAVRTTLARALNHLGANEEARLHVERALLLAEAEEDLPLEERFELLLIDLYVHLDANLNWDRQAMQWWDCCEQLIELRDPVVMKAMRPLRHRRLGMKIEDVRSGLRDVLRTASERLSPDDSTWVYVGAYLQACGHSMGAQRGVDLTLAALEIFRRHLPDTHAIVARCVVLLLDQHIENKSYAEAEGVAREQLRRLERALPEDHWYLAHGECRLGEALLRGGRAREAEPVLRSAFERFQRSFGPGTPAAFDAASLLLELCRATEMEEAERWRNEAAVALAAHEWSLSPARLASILPPERQRHIDALKRLDEGGMDGSRDPSVVVHLLALGRELPNEDPLAACFAGLLAARGVMLRFGLPPELVDRLFAESIAVLRESRHAHPAKVARALQEYAQFLNEQGRFSEAERTARDALARLQKVYGEANAWTANARRHLALALAGLGRAEEAEPLLLASYRTHCEASAFMGINPRTAYRQLAELYAQSKGPAVAAAFCAEELRRTLRGPTQTATWFEYGADTILMLPGVHPDALTAALEAAQRARELAASPSAALAIEGQARIRLGQHAEGLALIESAIAAGRAPGAWAEGALALARHALGRREDAERSLLRMVELMQEESPPSPLLQRFVEEVEGALRE